MDDVLTAIEPRSANPAENPLGGLGGRPWQQPCFGPEILPGTGVRFRFWAPALAHVLLAIEGAERRIAMTALPDGWHEVVTSQARPGTLYRFVLPDGETVPDPASRFQPSDVSGPSEVIDPSAFTWDDGEWRGRPWEDAVIYEMHVGAFTPEGTFSAAAARLGQLAGLGVTAVELMPVADFPGTRNWGYDGVLPFAPDASYGRPEELKAFVSAAHRHGIMVLLDVVYNHFGPSGNFLGSYAPAFFSETHHSPWGAAINFDGRDSAFVRRFFVENALYWTHEFHIDGLRLDAVHAIVDKSPVHILTEIAARVRETSDRPRHLILENVRNEAHWMREASGGAARYSAQWNDDVHHGLHTLATGETAGYYAEFGGRTDLLARALAEGFAFQGENGRGEESTSLPSIAFVTFGQNHDQIGNRAFGNRLATIAPVEAVRAITAIVLLSPQIPLLFMGEEWGASSPFPFFCDFDDELAERVRNGRREEFASFPEFCSEESRSRLPDPQSAATFAAAKLDWSERAHNCDWLRFYGQLLDTRRLVVRPLLPHIHGDASRWQVFGPGAFEVTWDTPRGTLQLEANVSAEATRFPGARMPAFWEEGAADADVLGAWAVRWSIR